MSFPFTSEVIQSIDGYGVPTTVVLTEGPNRWQRLQVYERLNRFSTI